MAWRYIPKWLRERIFARARGHCERTGCGAPITWETFEAAHLRAHSHGGSATEENLQAWCLPCNDAQGARDVADTRTPPRAWQIEAADIIVAEIMARHVATVTAAPGAGKTIFAALVFERLAQARFVDRMVVMVPRRTLRQQWHDSLRKHRHLELGLNRAWELNHQAGVVITYQQLLQTETLRNHVDQLERGGATLVVTDEAHHLGTETSWSRALAGLVGNVGGQLHVAAILNMSGTLWRSLPGQHIPTVRYQRQDDGKELSISNYDIPADKLIESGDLRDVDLTRMGASVQINDYRALGVIDSHTADLTEKNDKPLGRAVLRGLPSKAQWRREFVGAMLEKLDDARESLGGQYPVKGLIVAFRQKDAEAFCETVNEIMRARGRDSLAVLATSDLPDAQTTLENFRRDPRVGILCTVDMAGEGYDCPDICVVGFASNKLTPLYIRQVVARGQRVTDKERALGFRLPCVVVAPAVEELVSHLARVLLPMIHEVEAGEEKRTQQPRAPSDSVRMPAFELTQVTPDADTMASIAGDETRQVAGQRVRRMADALKKYNLPPSHALRHIYAQDDAAQAERDADPFGSAERAKPNKAPMSEEQKTATYRRFLQHAAGWFLIHGPADMPKQERAARFQFAVNNAANIPKGGRKHATVEQLLTMALHARRMIFAYCKETGTPLPAEFIHWLQDPEDHGRH